MVWAPLDKLLYHGRFRHLCVLFLQSKAMISKYTFSDFFTDATRENYIELCTHAFSDQ